MKNLKIKETIVHLKAYDRIGTDSSLKYDESGKVLNTSNVIKIAYNSTAYSNYLKNINMFGFAKIEVFKVSKLNKDKYEPQTKEVFEAIKKEVHEATSHKKEIYKVDKVDESSKIAELEAKLDKLMKINESKESDHFAKDDSKKEIEKSA